ncbi:hypothetical protein [Saccharopolyspora griseoalba]|uniref:Uncharacterized protein n=1 Tax=Saccharopolyspora griseoalba TaxID=1431848 RepID=A0ABW2LGL3_9PSEU
MTIQDDLSRPWFQPVVPSGAEQQDSGPPTTRIAGSLPLDEVIAETPAAPTRPASANSTPPGAPPPPNGLERPAPQPARPQPPMAPAPAPEHVEVTQPYIPAIRDEQPEFAKRLNPEPSPVLASAPTGPQQPVAPAPELDTPAPAPTVPKRSLMRRVVRAIIGPDLLRKDPPKKKR